jgi:hypothetical protein
MRQNRKQPSDTAKGRTVPDGQGAPSACSPSMDSSAPMPKSAGAVGDNNVRPHLDTTEFLILEDGRILVHNLTPEFARLLLPLSPQDEVIRQRANSDQKP